MTAAWLWRSAWLRSRERLTFLGVLGWLAATLALWTGMLLSLAFLAVGALLAVQTVFDLWAERPLSAGRAWWLHQAVRLISCTGCGLITLGLVLTLFG
jgi:hypothetical protein